jgi:hypothetical protein
MIDEQLLSIRGHAISELMYSRKQRVIQSLSHSQTESQNHPANSVGSKNDLIARTDTLLSSPALTRAFFF